MTLAGEERGRLVERECAAEPELKAEVEALLASHLKAGDFIEHSPVAPTGEGEATEALDGETLGAYRILERIGHGGMGTVFLAERDDDQYHQRVAIKVVRWGLDSPLFVARFRRERQILADLEHPGIARLLDGGTLDDGRPYLVMEHIEGEPLDVYCRRRSLPIRQRLELFLEVCAAVQFAHRNLVIHRDLKPSNILVTPEGEPKLLDFGTASLLDPVTLDAAETQTGPAMLTPHYASPEQLRGGTITTATDVYALGVVLYELLADRRPFELAHRLSHEMMRVVCEEAPAPPSQRALWAAREDSAEAAGSPAERRRWARRLEGDLDTIVLTAMHKEPQRRYPSVEGLAEDVRRHLESLPIQARRDAFAYRAGKFLRRNRLAVAATLAIAIVLAGGVAATWVERQRTAQADARAVDLLTEAETVTEFLLELFAASDPAQSGGDEITARQILEQGVELVEEATREQPAVQARLMNQLGQVYLRLDDPGRATQLLERALAVRRELGTEHVETASILSRLGQVLTKQEDFSRAEALLSEALELRKSLFGPTAPQVAESYDLLGEYHYVRGRYRRAKELHAKARAIHRETGNGETDAVDLGGIAKGLNNLGAACYALGELDEAESHFRESLVLRERAGLELHPELAVTLDNLSAALAGQGRQAEALVYTERALALERRLYADASHRQVATTLGNLGSLLHQLGRHGEAEDRLREALKMREELLGGEHHAVASSLYTLAVFHQDRGESSTAEAHYRRACAIWAQSLGDGHPDTRSCSRALAWHLYWSGNPDQAVDLFAAQVRGERREPSEEALLLPESLLGLALVLADGGRPETALPHFREAYAERRRLLGDDRHSKVVSARERLAGCLVELGRYEEAEPLLLLTLAHAEESGEDPAALAEARERLDALYRAWGRARAASSAAGCGP